MRREAFRFLVQLINSKGLGTMITRVELVKHMLSVYKPGPTSPSQSSCRSISDRMLTYFVKIGALRRVGRGKCEVLKHVPSSLKYDSRGVEGSYDKEERKDN